MDCYMLIICKIGMNIAREIYRIGRFWVGVFIIQRINQNSLPYVAVLYHFSRYSVYKNIEILKEKIVSTFEKSWKYPLRKIWVIIF